ncbi:hypothetical protein [Rivibacter subsaxonicus]|uniref:Uncharacterized protein n=1 Tax=Rivibacter subsaxonicus TaxID=457575 RepID=A0A4Q7W089_9BURK|nr:hypothetical protein [Rivibacter subsaxonicus]RZU02614.1 hypothetical protein EV670_0642 [Rivibacter subsaxonicus]
MSDEGHDHIEKRWSKHFEEIDLQIVQLATMCDVKLLDPGVVERVLHNDSTVCGRNKPETFAKLRALLMMHYSSQAKAVVALGEEDALRVVSDTLDRLRERIGGRLGGSART